MIRRLLIFSCWLLSSTVCISQTEDKENGKYFTTLSAGFGMIYGGIGANLEFGKKHISAFVGSGYATRRKLETVTIEPSFNFNGGLRYYFKTKSNAFYPRIGVGAGWITNYFSDSLINSNYQHNAQGAFVHAGAQFYSNSGVVFNFDLAMSSRYLLFDRQKSPNFYFFYIRPCIGIGLDINQLLEREKRKTIKNKELNPLG